MDNNKEEQVIDKESTNIDKIEIAVIEILKDHCDETEYRYELGKDCVDFCARDIVAKVIKMQNEIDNTPLTVEELRSMIGKPIYGIRTSSWYVPISIINSTYTTGRFVILMDDNMSEYTIGEDEEFYRTEQNRTVDEGSSLFKMCNRGNKHG